MLAKLLYFYIIFIFKIWDEQVLIFHFVHIVALHTILHIG